MKRLAHCLLLSVVAVTGCITPPTTNTPDDLPPPKPAVEFQQQEPPAKAVQPDDISETNARQKSQDLRDEILRAQKPVR